MPFKRATKEQEVTLTQEPTAQILQEVITSLRKNPRKFQAVRRALKKADSDEERVKQLIRFATSERELAALLPARLAGAQAAAWTTVTVTTVFILEDSAY
jgi:hypothetical protein